MKEKRMLTIAMICMTIFTTAVMGENLKSPHFIRQLSVSEIPSIHVEFMVQGQEAEIILTSNEPVVLAGAQLGLLWNPHDTINFVPTEPNSMAGFPQSSAPGNPNQDISDGDAMLTWLSDVFFPPTVNSNGFCIGSISFDNINTNHELQLVQYVPGWIIPTKTTIIGGEDLWDGEECSVNLLSTNIEFELDKSWMYQNLPGQHNCSITATVDDNPNYSYEWEFVPPTIYEDIELSTFYTCGVIFEDLYTQTKTNNLSAGWPRNGQSDSQAFWTFDVSSLPKNAIIESIQFNYEVSSAYKEGNLVAFFAEEPNTPESSSGTELWASSGKIYYEIEPEDFSVGSHTVNLNANAIYDLQESSNLFSIQCHNYTLVRTRKFLPQGFLSVTYSVPLVEPVIVDGCGTEDAYCEFASPSCDTDGFSYGRIPYSVRVTVKENDVIIGAMEDCFEIYLLGDVNHDGIVDVVDRSIVNAFWRRGFAGPFTAEDCDVNCDGEINVVDRQIVNSVWRGFLCDYKE